MRKLAIFNHVSLDGYIADAGGDMSWAHASDPEWNAFASENAGGNGVLLFGRITYELMARYWPTPMAMQNNAAVAEGMNRMEKVVFSRTLNGVSWSNTRLVKSDPVSEVRKIKEEEGPDLVILGSGSIVAQLTQAGLIDEFQIVVNPVILGKGKTMFESVSGKPRLKLAKTRAFQNGNLVVYYERAA